jgi:histidinol dehydrogenase
MRIVAGQEAEELIACIAARGEPSSGIEVQVRQIVNDVRSAGDDALRNYAARWDGLSTEQPLRLSATELAAARKSLSSQLRKSLTQAAQNIRRFCGWQKPRSWTRTRGGIALGQTVIPLDSVGCYVPGGRYPLVSTVLMTVIPAQVAGVKKIRVVSPNPSREVVGAAAMLGVSEFYRVGGAQAIAALAYGTHSVPRVDKIVGPGNAYVTAAKKLVAFDCAIDFLAGPTEALILSESGNPEFIAADLIAQAEHDVDALVSFITTSQRLGERVVESVGRQAKGNRIAEASLQKHSAVFIAESRAQARQWANRMAPEHITVEQEDTAFIQNAGSVFIGEYSAQAAGDYVSGPNHVLPTA